MKLRYKHQMILAVVIIILGNALGTIFRTWMYRSAAFVICGLMWIVNPVMAANVPATKERITWTRVAGAILILIGVFTRVNVW